MVATLDYNPPLMVRDDDEESLLDTEKVKARRLALELNQQEAADRAGLKGGRQQWNSIESGRRASITLGTLGRIAKALGVQPAELLLPLPPEQKAKSPAKEKARAKGKGKSDE